jgi:hypothetical protein
VATQPTLRACTSRLSSSSSSSSHQTGAHDHDTYDMNRIKEAVDQCTKLNGEKHYVNTVADVVRYFNLPLRVVWRWMAVFKEDGRLPDALPKRGKPPYIKLASEVALAAWCGYEASMQRSVEVGIVKAKAHAVWIDMSHMTDVCDEWMSVDLICGMVWYGMI